MRVLVVGSTPPPFYGQAIMISHLIDSEMPGIEFVHVRTQFSKDMSGMGKAGFRKALHLIAVIGRIVTQRARTGCEVLYYAPGGTSLAPIIRDILILNVVRPLFKRTVFHFHAGGLDASYSRLGKFGRWVFERAYWEPDLGIRISSLTPEDAKFVQSKVELVIPNGLVGAPCARLDRTITQTLRLLYVGHLSEGKGIFTSLNSLALLKSLLPTLQVKFTFVGEFQDRSVKSQFESSVKELAIENEVRLTGSLDGAPKWKEFHDADLFIFPSHFASETFGMVLVEAMSAGVPVIATDWRGIPEIVKSGENGILVPTKNATAVAEAIVNMVESRDLREQYAKKGLETYEQRFTLGIWIHAMSKAFCLINPANDAGDPNR